MEDKELEEALARNYSPNTMYVHKGKYYWACADGILKEMQKKTFMKKL